MVGIENDIPIGIAPFSIPLKPLKRAKLLQFNSIQFLCTGPVAGRNVSSDYLDFIVTNNRREEFITGVLGFLVDNCEWEELVLENISSESDLTQLIRKESKEHNLNFEIVDDRPCALTELPDSWDVFLKNAGGNLRYKINRGRKEFEKQKGVYERVTEEDALGGAFSELERLHQNRWISRGGSGAFSDSNWREFHKRFIPIAHRNGWLRLSFLKLDGEAVAANYNFAYNGKIHFFQSGLVPHPNKHIRLGLILHSYCIEEAIREGFREYDFLRVSNKGAGYKDTWSNINRPLYNLRIARQTMKEKLYQKVKRFHS